MRLPDRQGLRMGLRSTFGRRAVRTLHGLVIVAFGLTAGSGAVSPGCGPGCAAGTERYREDITGHLVPEGFDAGLGGIVRCVPPPTPAWSDCPPGEVHFWQDDAGVLHPFTDPEVGESEVVRCVPE